jgi:hypothetical protein
VDATDVEQSDLRAEFRASIALLTLFLAPLLLIAFFST